MLTTAKLRAKWCGRWTRVSAEREAAYPWGVRLRIGIGTAQVCHSESEEQGKDRSRLARWILLIGVMSDDSY